MTEVSERHRRLSRAFADKIAAVPPDRWNAATPCTEWNVRDLVRHVTDNHELFLGLVGRDVRPRPSVDDDPLGAFTTGSDQIQSDLEDPARAGAEFDGYFGRSTFAQAIDRFLCFDLAVHGWDVARATGQDERLFPQDLPWLWAGTELFGDAIRSEGVCGPAVDPPPDADEQARLLSYLGRHV
ncbi:TIGR03086 family protein [Haloechinothrix alba]|uniref:TIGR03086 family protein n=1 Tax=Haloechinothrix alba TaxID=664784 RepID=A0A238WZD0_9PSEU|nr:TIGR03086 family metal-binding protein [Haloechinothrix alba]SNR51768.1 TIGR03086 family protein [Haloechinothrix alba]